MTRGVNQVGNLRICSLNSCQCSLFFAFHPIDACKFGLCLPPAVASSSTCSIAKFPAKCVRAQIWIFIIFALFAVSVPVPFPLSTVLWPRRKTAAARRPLAIFSFFNFHDNCRQNSLQRFFLFHLYFVFYFLSLCYRSLCVCVCLESALHGRNCNPAWNIVWFMVQQQFWAFRKLVAQFSWHCNWMKSSVPLVSVQLRECCGWLQNNSREKHKVKCVTRKWCNILWKEL